MPDPNSDQIASESKEVDKSMKQKNNRRVAGREFKKRYQPASATDEKVTQHDTYRDLSILAPVSAASQSPLSSPGWLRDYQASGTNPLNAVLSKPRNNFLNHQADNDVTPAFDAGLDAKKCNSKQLMASSGESHLCSSHHDSSTASNRMQLNIDDKSYQDYDCLLVRFSSIMYATFLVILGCILHCSELRQKSKNSTDHIYTIIVALLGIAWLLFLQGDLQRYKRYASKYILIESIFNDHKQKMREMSQIGELAPSTSATRSTASSSASLVNDRMSMNTEVIFKKTAYKMYQRRAAALNDQPLRHGKFISHNYANSSARYSIAETSHTTKGLGETLDQGDVEHLVPAYKFLHGKMGANFYLKCGMAAFCFGHVIHEGLRFGQQLYFFGTGNAHCRDLAALIAHLITPLYSFYQLFMMFKYSNVSNH